MGPTSVAFFTVLVLSVLALGTAVLRARLLAVKLVCGVAALAVTAFTGVAGVNAYFQYFQTWNEIFAPPAVGLAAAAAGVTAGEPANYLGRRPGRLLHVDFQGAVSGISRDGYVYLPPQYGEPRYAAVRFPVIEMLHGWPGRPSDEIDVLHAVSFEEGELAARRMGPTILLMPNVNGPIGGLSEECVNAPGGAQDDTYLSTDLQTWVAAHLPQASVAPGSWGTLGYSEGGFCAVNLALHHPQLYSAAISLDGYFHAVQDVTTGNLYQGDTAAEMANDPFLELAHYPAGRPLPAVFLVSDSRGFYREQSAGLAAELGRAEQVPYVVQPGAHTYPAWRQALPMVLDWAWRTLATPSLARLFPLLAPVTGRGEYAGSATPLPASVFDSGLVCAPEVRVLAAAPPLRPAKPSPRPSPSPRPASPVAAVSPSPSARPSARPAPALSPSRSPTPSPRPSLSPSPSPSPSK